MHRTTLSALALAILAGGTVAWAEQHMAAEGMGATGSGVLTQEQVDRALRAEEVMEAEVYTMDEGYDEAAWNEATWFDEMGEGWESVGEVEDILFSRDGRIIGVVVETGGWLDLGDESYVVDLRDLRAVGEGDDVDFVTRLSRAQMEEMPRAETESWF